MSKEVSFNVGEGATLLRYCLARQGADVYIRVQGGQPHIGSTGVVMDGKVTIITASGHKDDFLVRPIAEAIAGVFKGTVVIMAGFHLDNITPEGIQQVLNTNAQAIPQLLRFIEEGRF